ncbi:hypothetical protein KQH60_03885 [Mycetohabitans sp. B8]|uniref:hypothetical protein n=1 Tax=Mycetohabitans sp. B8 TaxID=2841845 RepID=UPI001F2D3B76|nr:hypothetical protein [Mycetohabitans sp. B8]MCG1041757.1 hypothetical protein [Mycetohabitans sp. B8]
MADGEFHRALNRDVRFSKDALANAVEFMRLHKAAGMLAPRACGAHGSQPYLCRSFLEGANRLLRGFAPRFVQRVFKRQFRRAHRSPRRRRGMHRKQAHQDVCRLGGALAQPV